MADKDDDYRSDDSDPWVDRDEEQEPPESAQAPRPSSGPGITAEDPPPPLVDFDEDDDATGWMPPEAPAKELPRDHDNPFDLPAVDSDDVGEDALNAAAERELAALGEDRFPLDDKAEDTTEHATDGDGPVSPVAARSEDDGIERDDDWPPLIDSDDMTAGPGPDARPFDSPDNRTRRLPMVLLAVGVIALLLVLVGGYGVISERAALRAEVRELQARLATAGRTGGAATDAGEQARRRAADLEQQLATLGAENDGLRQRLEELRQRPEPGADDSSPGGQGSDEAAMDTSASSTQQTDSDSDAADSGPAPVAPAASGEETWFVNFSSYTDAANARRRAAGLSVDAGRVVVQDALSGDRTVFRVRVVELENREQADAVADKLAKAYGLSQLWVGKE